MENKKLYSSGLFIIGFIVGAIAAFSFVSYSNSNLFVRGIFGDKCYARGSEHGNIKHPLYFDTLDECLDSLLK